MSSRFMDSTESRDTSSLPPPSREGETIEGEGISFSFTLSLLSFSFILFCVVSSEETHVNSEETVVFSEETPPSPIVSSEETVLSRLYSVISAARFDALHMAVYCSWMPSEVIIF